MHAFSESSLGPLLISFFFVVVIAGFGLIAWRGDRLRSPGGIDAPLGREGAFLLNNVVFVGFAFVVLLGTVYPLLYEALTQQQVTVGAPFFNTVAIPAGLLLLFLMAIAPGARVAQDERRRALAALGHPGVGRRGHGRGVRGRRARGVGTLIGFGLGAMAAATVARALVLSVRAARPPCGVVARAGRAGQRRHGRASRRGLLAVGITAATSYRHEAELALHKDVATTYDGHRFEFVGLRTVSSPSRTAQQALVKVDGHLAPATTSFGSALSVVGTPAIDSGFFGDVYLTFDAVGGLGATSGNQAIANLPSGSVAIGVVIEPLVAWLWAGGLLVGLGGLLALVPGSAAGHRPRIGALGPGDRGARGRPAHGRRAPGGRRPGPRSPGAAVRSAPGVERS